MSDLSTRIARAWAAFWTAPVEKSFAVVYDVPELDDEGQPTGDFTEEYYEAFGTPFEAWYMFRTAFGPGDENTENARLVEILGPIDDYGPKPLPPGQGWP